MRLRCVSWPDGAVLLRKFWYNFLLAGCGYGKKLKKLFWGGL
jgi:hypothetical protein